MHGSATLKKVVAAWVTMCMILSSFGMMTIADDEPQVNNVTNGHLIFKGFNLGYGANGEIQALVDVYVDNIDATGIDFVLEYNRDYLEPSDYTSNNATEDVTKAFRPNGEIFTDAYPMLMYEEEGLELSVIKNSGNHGYIQLNLNPTPGAEGDKFGTAQLSYPVERPVTYVKSNGSEVKWGTISFIVNDPFEISNMTADNLRKILYIKGDPEVDPNSDPNEDEPYEAYISYVDGDRIDKFNGPKIPVIWQVSSGIAAAEPTVKSSTVSAYSLFQRAQTGKTADLITYLNQTMGGVIEIYNNGENNTEDKRIFWDNTAVITVDGTPIDDDNYDPKGGVTYTITQNYLRNPNIDITVTVKVTKSELTGFVYDNQIKSFIYPANQTVEWGDLELPPYIKPVISGVDDMYIAPTDKPGEPEGYNPAVDPEPTWDPAKWTPSDTEDIKAATPPPAFSMDYWHKFDISLLGVESISSTESQTLPWLSIPNSFSWDVNATRNVLPANVSPPSPGDDENPTIKAYVDRETGALIIEINADAFTDWIDPGTSFKIYLPNGMVLSTDTNSDFVSKSITGTSATIRIAPADEYDASNPDSNSMKEYRELIQSIINLGSDGFRISAIPSTGDLANIESDSLGFEFDPRINYYLFEDIDSQNRKYDKKDYSGNQASSIRVYESQALSGISTYIVFPASSTIEVAYNGQTGYQHPFVDMSDPNPAILNEAKVVSWTWEYADGTVNPDPTGPLPAAGTDIYLVGKLAPYSYTNLGFVYNTYEPPVDPADEVYLKLKLRTLQTSIDTSTPTPSPGDETPSPSPGDESPSPSPGDETPTPSPGDATPTPTPTATSEPNKIRISTMLNGGNGTVGTGPEVELNESLFEYDRKQEGYLPADVQNQVYKIENIGSNDLTSVYIRIDDIAYSADEDSAPQLLYNTPFIIGYNQLYTMTEDPDNPGTYLMGTPNVNSIHVGEEVYVDIRTRVGLDPGIYTAKVIVNTTNGGDLDYFNVKFKVTETTVYKVDIQNDYPNIGYGYLTDSLGGTAVASNTYEAGETVYLHAVVVDTDGYLFKQWLCTTGEALIFDDENPATTSDHEREDTSFEMVVPVDTATNTIVIIPDFDETNDVWVRLADLRSYNEDDAANPNELRNAITFSFISFDESTYNYAVIVPSDVNRNYVEFDVKDMLLGETPPMTVTLEYNGVALPLDPTDGRTVNPSSHTVTYKSELFDLSDPGPDVVTIKTEYVDNSNPYNPRTYTKTYTLKIYRKSAVQVDKQFGNSPMGLIYRVFPKDSPERAAAKAYFEANHTYVAYDDAGAYDNQYTPNLAATTYDTYYSTEAWGEGKNYDNDEYALFVYQGEAFVDPGYENLKYMDNTTDVPEDKVKRTIEGVYTYTPTSDILSDLDGAEAAASPIPVAAEGSTNVLIEELADKNVRPGVYTLRYSFKDQDDSESSFSRPIIVLANKGDLNMDSTGQADTEDAHMIYQRLNENSLYSEAISNTADVWRQLYAYRVGDVTEDRNVNSIDANAVLDISSGTYKQYYEKLPSATPEPSATAEPWPTVAPDATPKPIATLPPEKATLTLDFLGVAPAIGSSPLTPGLSKENNEYNPTKAATDPFAAFDSMIWVGIGIKDVLNLEYFLDGLYSVDLALDYDSEIFEPCDNSAKVESEHSSPADFKASYASMIKSTNLNPSVETYDVVRWRNGQLYEESLQYDLDLDTTGRYKTVFVTIKSSDLDSLRLSNIPDGTTETKYLLRLPFRLKKYPSEEYTGRALTINTTEQTFVLGATANGVKNSASWEGLVNKTTEVNNAKNHFDGPEIVDLFGTDGTFDVRGVITGWNPAKPFVVEFFKTTNLTDEPDYSFSSDTVNEANELIYGVTANTAQGEVTWNFKLPVSNLFDYHMRVKKLSHITYPEFKVERPSSASEVELTEQIDLIVGDINDDGFIKIPDRVNLMRFFDQHKPWELYTDRFEASDLNGDEKVNLFDLNLLKQNLEKAYPEPTPTTDPTGGGG